jgi:hypothetical protein
MSVDVSHEAASYQVLDSLNYMGSLFSNFAIRSLCLNLITLYRFRFPPETRQTLFSGISKYAAGDFQEQSICLDQRFGNKGRRPVTGRLPRNSINI